MKRRLHHKLKRVKRRIETHPSEHFESAEPMMGRTHMSDSEEHGAAKRKPKMFIAGAIKHPGALRKELHVKKGHNIPVSKLKAAEKKGGIIAKRARLAETLRKLSKHKKRK